MMRPVKTRLLVAGAALALAAGVALVGVRLARREAGVAGPAAFDAAQLGAFGPVPPFTLTERSGRPVRRDDLRGLVWVTDFIYTDCRDTCPTLSLEFAKLQAEFAGATDFRLVSISVDPVHDTPAVLRRYAERYHAGDRWLFLTGDRRAVYCLVRDGFKLSPAEESASLDCGPAVLGLGPAPAWAHGGTRTIVHTSRLALVDRAGRIRAYHSGDDPASLRVLRENVRRLLAER